MILPPNLEYRVAHFQKKTSAPRGTAARAAFFGRANQISHEAAENLERSQMKGRLSEQRKRAKDRGARYKAARSGANAGTVGGARGALMQAFMGR